MSSEYTSKAYLVRTTKPIDKLILIHLSENEQDGIAEAKLKELQRFTNQTRKPVIRSLRRLHDQGVIEMTGAITYRVSAKLVLQ